MCEMLIFRGQALPESVYPHVFVHNAAVPLKICCSFGPENLMWICERHMDNVIAKLYKQYILFPSRFGKVASLVKSQLFVNYCCSFYGVTLCDLNDIDSVSVAQRQCIRHIWNICPGTHCHILPYMTTISDTCWRSALLNITTVPLLVKMTLSNMCLQQQCILQDL